MTSQNAPRLNTLFKLYLDNSISAAEYQEFLRLLNNDTINHDLSLELQELWAQSAGASLRLPGKIWDDKMGFLISQINDTDTEVAPVRKISGWYKSQWAAAILLVVFSSTVFYFLNKRQSSPAIISTVAKKHVTEDLSPGGNKAILVLADGSSIVLDSSSDGTIASQGNAKVIKLNTGQLAYQSSGNDPREVVYNTLSTPRGGQYQVVLPDGSLVWLNSASSLRFPTSFSGTDRKVEITGEAYFEIAKNPGRPFKVKINLLTGEGGEIEVLGTHFNVNAFEDEPAVHTTLFEGRVRVNSSTGTAQIKPGQQLQLDKTGKANIVNDTDLEEVIAWKEGKFHFEDEDIKYVMRQIARWYNVEVEYRGNIEKHFDGTISKNTGVLKVLNMLELTGEVNFEINGRKVTVLP